MDGGSVDLTDDPVYSGDKDCTDCTDSFFELLPCCNYSDCTGYFFFNFIHVAEDLCTVGITIAVMYQVLFFNLLHVSEDRRSV